MAKAKQRKHYTIFDVIHSNPSKLKWKSTVAEHDDFSAEAKTHQEARRLLIGKIFDNLRDYTNEAWLAQSYDYGEGQERLWAFAQANDECYWSEWFH
jgi:hypothetical protein